MKKLYKILVPVLLGCAASCDSGSEYPVIPKIEFQNLEFFESTITGGYDSLVLQFKFQDGDGDIGLEAEIHHEPYHPLNYFLAKDGNLYPVSTFVGTTNDSPPRIFSPIIYLGGDQQGKLATLKTKDQPGYEFMPDNSCLHYRKETVYVIDFDSRIIDDSYNIVDTLEDVSPKLFKVVESFYIEKNENANNIYVDFLVEQPDATFEKFDLEKELCTTFDARIPDISKSRNNFTNGPFQIRKLSNTKGAIIYALRSRGFRTVFGGKKVKLRVYIKDRALHSSNIVETNIIQF